MIREFFNSIQWWQIVKEGFFIVVVVLVMNFVLPRSIVRGHSMEPNLYEGNRLAGSPIPYWVGEPQRGDIIMLYPVEENGPNLVKRIIGLPGETIEIYEQQVYVDGQLLEEDYIQEPCRRYRCNDAVWVLGDDELFVMGDNRNVSRDSRNYGAVTSDKIMAKVILRWWPLTELSTFNPL
ncbi:MAG: signal peptidase I [Anaerolineae bacterium]|nr:signal peptidase I [Anaerolineae bacterium]